MQEFANSIQQSTKISDKEILAKNKKKKKKDIQLEKEEVKLSLIPHDMNFYVENPK